MITVKAHITREISKLKKIKKNLKQELETINNTAVIKDTFKTSNTILKKEMLKIDAKIEALLWVATTNQKNLPKLNKNKKKGKNDTKSAP